MQAVAITYQAVFEKLMNIEWPSQITCDKAIDFIQALIRKRSMENTDVLEFTDMARNYFAIKLGENYRAITRPLLDAGILQSTNYYRPGYEHEEGFYVKGQCLSYRINPTLLGDDIIQVVYQQKRKIQKCRDEVTMASKQIMRQLRIPTLSSLEIVKVVRASMTDHRVRGMLKVGSEIIDPVVMLRSYADESIDEQGNDPQPKKPIKKMSVRFVKRENIRSIYIHDGSAKHENGRRRKVLIKDGKYCYIDFLDDYIKRKRRQLVQAYCDQLLRIKHRNIYADRNDTNLRLDSNITNLKSEYISLLTLDDQRLSQIDLKNSQFRFFIMLMEQCEREIIGSRISHFPGGFQIAEKSDSGPQSLRIEEGGNISGKQVTLLCVKMLKNCIDDSRSTLSFTADYKLFKTLGKSGKLYEYIQKIYWQETGEEISRDKAKKLMFTVAFASYRHNPIGKQVLKTHFPSIIQLIDDFKSGMIQEYSLDSANKVDDKAGREAGNASFAIMLQQTESLVFIDRILAKCHKKGIKALSKHDSILCRQSDKHKVTKIICKVLNQLFGRFSYSLDIDGKVFELRAKKKSRMGRFVHQFVNTLFGMECQANAPPQRFQLDNLFPIVNRAGVNPKLSSSKTHQSDLSAEKNTEAVSRLNPRIEALRKKFGVGNQLNQYNN